MNYDFPKIETIGDVLPHIEGRDEIKVYERDSYTVIDYVITESDTFDIFEENPVVGMIRRECRGLVFDKNGKLISRPYHKFFNVNEREETQSYMIDLSQPHIVMDKLDGSMVHSCVIDEEIRLLTRNGITEYSLAAEEFIKDKEKYIDFIGLAKALGWCCIFEWCSPNYPNVINYPEENLILTAMRCINSGGYADYNYMQFFANSYGVPLVEAITFDGSLSDIIETVKNWNTKEGVVIRFRPGHMIKIKSLDYLLKHKARDSIVFEKDVIDLIISNKIDDVICYLPEHMRQHTLNYVNLFWKNFNKTCQDLHDLYEPSTKEYYDQKQFALRFVSKLDKKYHRFMYTIRSNGDLKKELIDYIAFYVGSSTRLDKVRWVWRDLTWDPK